MTDLIAELAAQSKWLRKAAAEIAAEGHAGWGNTCLQAAETIDTHAAEIEAMARDAEQTKRAAESLCRVYFEIASEAIGEDCVRAERDKRLTAMRSAKEDGNG